MHKTGTTSIQHSLEGFEDDRFLYARIGMRSNHSLPLYSLFANRPERHHLHVAAGRTGAALELYIRNAEADLRSSIASAAGRTLIISAETVSSLRPPAIHKLRQFLEPHFDEISVVAYIRPPAGFMASAFQAKVRSRGLDRFEPERNYRPYRASFETVDDAFGRGNVSLWKFDPAAFPESCVVRDFCSRLCISLPESKIVRRNEGPTRELIKLFYAYNKFHRSLSGAALPRHLGKRLQLLLDGIGNTKFRFSPSVVEPILDNWGDDIAWMENRLGETLRGPAVGDRPGDIRSEADLLEPDPAVIDQCLARLGDTWSSNDSARTRTSDALVLHRLMQMWDEHVQPASPAAEIRNVGT